MSEEDEITDRVVRATNHTLVLGGEQTGWLPSGALRPLDSSRMEIDLHVQIIATGHDGYYLVWRDASGDYTGDSWHGTLEEALSQAEVQFGITAEEWPS